MATLQLALMVICSLRCAHRYDDDAPSLLYGAYLARYDDAAFSGGGHNRTVVAAAAAAAATSCFAHAATLQPTHADAYYNLALGAHTQGLQPRTSAALLITPD